MDKFNTEKFIRRIAWVAIAFAVGIASVADTINWDTFSWSWAAVAGLGYAVFRAAVGWLVKSGKVPAAIERLL